MAKSLRETYSQKALNQIPRLLSLMNRNALTPAYGCMDRTYWLDKATDFPSAIAQYGVHALSLAYAKPFPNNPYYRNPKVRDWAVAGIDYWLSIQHDDGSFDEFYPNERGWAGPTGFLLYAMMASVDLMQSEIPAEFKERVFESAKKSALFLAGTEEHGVLSNHHAMALLPIYYAYKMTRDKALLYNFGEKLDKLISFQSREGWFLEYDGADPGYLSATVSFLAKLYDLLEEEEWKKKLWPVIQSAIRFCAYFAYPNGHYGGTIGSRQTLHFYAHGFEYFGKKDAVALSVAAHLLKGLHDGALVSPEIMPDRYLPYRVNELLQAYLDYTPRTNRLVPLPFQEKPFSKHFTESNVLVVKKPNYYAVANLAKGGVLKSFNSKNGKLECNDCGTIIQSEKELLTTQWIDSERMVSWDGKKAVVSGKLQRIQSIQPTPWKMIALRLAQLVLANSEKSAYWLKGKIREKIILSNPKSDSPFDRTIEFGENAITITDHIQRAGGSDWKCVRLGDEFSVRYVPQSMYFQPQELETRATLLSKELVEQLVDGKSVSVKRAWKPGSNALSMEAVIG